MSKKIKTSITRSQTKELSEEEKDKLLLKPTDLPQRRSRSTSPTTSTCKLSPKSTPTKDNLDSLLTEDEDSDKEPEYKSPKNKSIVAKHLNPDTFPDFLQSLEQLDNETLSKTIVSPFVENPQQIDNTLTFQENPHQQLMKNAKDISKEEENENSMAAPQPYTVKLSDAPLIWYQSSQVKVMVVHLKISLQAAKMRKICFPKMQRKI